MTARPSDAARIAREFLRDPEARQHLYPLGKLVGLRLIRVTRVLDRFMAVGWIVDGWEEGSDPRWPRRYYVATDLGRAEMPAILREASEVP